MTFSSYMSSKPHRSIQLKVPLFIFREGRTYVSYSPALDLASCGKTPAHARRMFAEAMQLFIEFAVERGTLAEILLEQGWTKSKAGWRAPRLIGPPTYQTVKVPA
jgi:predicted RNase H-like HicB family nuclease